MEAPLQQLHHPLLQEQNIQLWLKREDLLHPTISGNKWRKLKYNLQEAKQQQKSTLLTFGGAYSNHIAAVAAAGEEFGFRTIGIIRGEEHLPLNPTLHLATTQGMELQYVSREVYRQKSESEFLKALAWQYQEPYILPEGGTNNLAVKGCTEIIADIEIEYDYLCCASGTGGTLAGVIAGLEGEKQVLGFPSLKGGAFLQQEIEQLIRNYNGKTYNNWQLFTDYHFGGYAKVKPELLAFMQAFWEQHQVPLEPVYTGKMMFGIFNLLQKGFFASSSRIVAVHTGGLQGNAGFRERLGLQV
ncbi:1-aminocyclopropane-1-carboxylate deaminase/D-cysteine desulfhydrase [Pontibacter qinzhouensis]|uniref:1-aminocyclopropane-1-carboxylate deaminase/D-cysteine desulfhydrase n=1 Tax=Pontibacter qinzhouensis TaxID=2603253 RepID=A0A5C8J7H7_9BACT|nr:pyridoxal-phosphate dependent enzyme [Pontibacter qinzhouensis]TXK33870.1 1-aminocyclopropane-1-carboxylate deaminase/D-cysteine desulfhydrase [Pontibacter qinzhouensis]